MEKSELKNLSKGQAVELRLFDNWRKIYYFKAVSSHDDNYALVWTSEHKQYWIKAHYSLLYVI